jgi:hypothetical protein
MLRALLMLATLAVWLVLTVGTYVVAALDLLVMVFTDVDDSVGPVSGLPSGVLALWFILLFVTGSGILGISRVASRDKPHSD